MNREFMSGEEYESYCWETLMRRIRKKLTGHEEGTLVASHIEMINSKTNLSEVTIKRIFNLDNSYKAKQHQIETKNNLAIFEGNRSYASFCKKLEEELDSQVVPSPFSSGDLLYTTWQRGYWLFKAEKYVDAIQCFNIIIATVSSPETIKFRHLCKELLEFQRGNNNRIRKTRLAHDLMKAREFHRALSILQDLRVHFPSLKIDILIRECIDQLIRNENEKRG